jgi:hypothetical protein
MVDMDEHRPLSIRSRPGRGFTVLSSTPCPFNKHCRKLAYKEVWVLYAPPPWIKEAMQAVFDYTVRDCRNGGGNLGGIQTWAQVVKRPFEFYFNVFGGTLRGLHLPEVELTFIAQGR